MAGYHNFSKSNNAICAEKQGKYPASKAAKIYGFKSIAALKSLIKPSEWHHTSKFYNHTDYYDIEGEIENFCDLIDVNRIIRALKKNSKGRELCLDKARSLISENNFDSLRLIYKLRIKAGYFNDRKRNIKRKYY